MLAFVFMQLLAITNRINYKPGFLKVTILIYIVLLGGISFEFPLLFPRGSISASKYAAVCVERLIPLTFSGRNPAVVFTVLGIPTPKALQSWLKVVLRTWLSSVQMKCSPLKLDYLEATLKK